MKGCRVWGLDEEHNLVLRSFVILLLVWRFPVNNFKERKKNHQVRIKWEHAHPHCLDTIRGKRLRQWECEVWVMGGVVFWGGVRACCNISSSLLAPLSPSLLALPACCRFQTWRLGFETLHQSPTYRPKKLHSRWHWLIEKPRHKCITGPVVLLRPLNANNSLQPFYRRVFNSVYRDNWENHVNSRHTNNSSPSSAT